MLSFLSELLESLSRAFLGSRVGTKSYLITCARVGTFRFWMAHKPQTMSEVYSHLHEELEIRLAEAERVGYGFDLP
jgi:hypothetical protein